MHLAPAAFRVSPLVAACLLLGASACYAAGTPDRTPLVGSGPPAPSSPASANPGTGAIVVVDPTTLPCLLSATFDDVDGGTNPGTSYDGILFSVGVSFAERFAGQAIGSSGDFDVVTGVPTSPLTLQVGAPGQNLDVFAYANNVLTGLGPIGYPDMDAIGEGSIAIAFALPQSQVKLDVVGGNGGSATLSFYRSDGTLLDTVTLSGLGDSTFGFATSSGQSTISGILVQNTDPSGIGIDNVCYDPHFTSTRRASWGGVKSSYR